jgi:hypothetical protein
MRLRFAVDRFNDFEVHPALRHAAALGIDLSTMLGGSDIAQNRRVVYELNKTCLSD